MYTVRTSEAKRGKISEEGTLKLEISALKRFSSEMTIFSVSFVQNIDFLRNYEYKDLSFQLTEVNVLYIYALQFLKNWSYLLSHNLLKLKSP